MNLSKAMAAMEAGLMDAEMQQVDDIAKARVLVISDGRKGGENRSVGLAEMLGFKDPEVVTLLPKYKGRLPRLLPVGMLFADYGMLVRDIKDFDVVIGAGYQMSRVLRALKKVKPKLFTVALMRPAGRPGDFDVVAVEQHDHYRKAANVVVTLGATNRITRERLAVEGDRWRRRLAGVKGYRLAVLIGGDSKHSGFDAAQAKVMVKECERILAGQGGLLVTTSRRSGPAVTEALEKALRASKLDHYLWTPDDPTNRDNPYLAYLALADGVLVTADSVSMVSEAASAGKPVYLWGEPKRVPRKFRAFYEALCRQGRARWWNGRLDMRPPAAGLMDNLLAAGFVRARWAKREREAR